MTATDVRIVALAGGQGSRFWPISRKRRPKLFLSIDSSGESLIQATVRRVKALSSKNPIVVSNVLQRSLVLEHVPNAEVIAEPVMRNTAASIGLAAATIAKENANAIMVILPSDHWIGSEDKFRRTIARAIDLAAREPVIVTIGIAPSSAHTGYGYIKRGAQVHDKEYRVGRFFEKPNEERAKRYFESGDFYWNSGMFVMSAAVCLAAIKEHMPELSASLGRFSECLGKASTGKDDIERVIREALEPLESISIDFGILEHARDCCVVEAEDFEWSDVGSWDSWAHHFKTDENGNLLYGDALVIDSKKCVVHSEKKFTAVIGGEDLIIIDSPDALLVCPRSRVQDVRKIVEELKIKGREDLI